jgi:hypothetical protein
MKRHSRLPLLLLAALIMALSYLGGALAAPLRNAGATAPVAPEVTTAQWGALQAALGLLLDNSGDLVYQYLPTFLR